MQLIPVFCDPLYKSSGCCALIKKVTTHLKEQIEAYHDRHGFYPEVVIGDQIYGSRENRRYLKSRGIRFSGKKLGRPVQITAENRQEVAAEKKRRKSEQGRRNRIEGRFGVGRRRYGLGRVRTRLQETSETTICMTFFAMSIAAYLAACFVQKMMQWWRLQATRPPRAGAGSPGRSPRSPAFAAVRTLRAVSAQSTASPSLKKTGSGTPQVRWRLMHQSGRASTVP